MVAEEPPPTAPTFEELEASLDERTLSMPERVVEDGMSEEDGTLERHHHFKLRERESLLHFPTLSLENQVLNDYMKKKIERFKGYK